MGLPVGKLYFQFYTMIKARGGLLFDSHLVPGTICSRSSSLVLSLTDQVIWLCYLKAGNNLRIIKISSLDRPSCVGSLIESANFWRDWDTRVFGQKVSSFTGIGVSGIGFLRCEY